MMIMIDVTEIGIEIGTGIGLGIEIEIETGIGIGIGRGDMIVGEMTETATETEEAIETGTETEKEIGTDVATMNHPPDAAPLHLIVIAELPFQLVTFTQTRLEDRPPRRPKRRNRG